MLSHGENTYRSFMSPLSSPGVLCYFVELVFLIIRNKLAEIYMY